MNLALTAQPFISSEKFDNIKKQDMERMSTQNSARKNKTVKRKVTTMDLFKTGIKQLNTPGKMPSDSLESFNDINKDGDDLENFEPIDDTNEDRSKMNDEYLSVIPQKPDEKVLPKNDGSLSHIDYSKISQNVSSEYPNQYVPYFTEVTNAQKLGEKDVLLEKLNYMVHLLEEQQNEKTNNVTEEVVLYCFLGVFVIFMTDSFARASKYTR